MLTIHVKLFALLYAEQMFGIFATDGLLAMQDPGKRSFHFCIVNLVIGTLYCVKGNYEFGIARIIKSMEPESKKLETDTWFYAKRCFLALFEGVAKHMISLKVGAKHTA